MFIECVPVLVCGFGPFFELAGKLNVSITRAKRKTIIVVGDGLFFSPTPLILERTEAAEGFRYLTALVRKAHEECNGQGGAFMENLTVNIADLMV
jgi:hypothetical protein